VEVITSSSKQMIQIYQIHNRDYGFPTFFVRVFEGEEWYDPKTKHTDFEAFVYKKSDAKYNVALVNKDHNASYLDVLVAADGKLSLQLTRELDFTLKPAVEKFLEPRRGSTGIFSNSIYAAVAAFYNHDHESSRPDLHDAAYLVDGYSTDEAHVTVIFANEQYQLQIHRKNDSFTLNQIVGDIIRNTFSIPYHVTVDGNSYIWSLLGGARKLDLVHELAEGGHRVYYATNYKSYATGILDN